MKRSLGKASANSLELLLDTICNMFGSIILITLLIVIVTSEKPIDQILDTNQGPDREEIARRIETARLQIESLQNEIQKERANAPAASADENHATDLQAQIQAAKTALQAALRDQQTAFDRTSPEFAQTLRDFKTRLESLAKEISELENQLSDSQRRRPALQAELASLQAAHKGLVGANTEKIRLPKERSTDKSPFFVICRYNKVYPVYVVSSSGNLRVNPHVKTLSLDADSDAFLPIPEEGIPADAQKIRSALSQTPSRYYIVCLVFPDSVESFRQLRKGLGSVFPDIAWKPKRADDDVVLTTAGKGDAPPKPQ
jgi:chaperonin cofactor prefoldin